MRLQLNDLQVDKLYWLVEYCGSEQPEKRTLVKTIAQHLPRFVIGVRGVFSDELLCLASEYSYFEAVPYEYAENMIKHKMAEVNRLKREIAVLKFF